MPMDVETLTHIVNTIGEELKTVKAELVRAHQRIDELLDWVNR